MTLPITNLVKAWRVGLDAKRISPSSSEEKPLLLTSPFIESTEGPLLTREFNLHNEGLGRTLPLAT
jgi:hypothetical protein